MRPALEWANLTVSCNILSHNLGSAKWRKRFWRNCRGRCIYTASRARHICMLRDNWPVIDWREPIGLQERLEGRSSHNGEFSVMSRGCSKGNSLKWAHIHVLTHTQTLQAWFLPERNGSRGTMKHVSSSREWLSATRSNRGTPGFPVTQSAICFDDMSLVARGNLAFSVTRSAIWFTFSVLNVDPARASHHTSTWDERAECNLC